ncbi:MAG: hypothetical protein KDB40_00300 [Acidimicrobiales bacterium]|nr:hypothetical protein [Acidimicrobiales bacterium]MCB9392836.1 hypothetical protein [Acidimicrobiaceae bacterium]
MSRAPVDRRLADDPAARRAVIALGLFSLAEQAVWVTVLVIAHRSGGVAEAGTVSAALMLPAAVVAPFAAREVHDSGLRHPLPASYAMQTGALVLATATLALGLDPIVFYLSAAMVTVTVVFSRPAHHAVLARHGSTVAATVATGVATGAAQLGGPLLAAGLIAVVGPTSVFAVATCLLAAAALLTLRVEPVDDDQRSREPGSPRPDRVLRPVRSGCDPRPGLARPGIARGSLAVLGVLGMVTLVLGTIESIATEVSWRLGSTGSGTGVLLGAAGAGLLVGARLGGAVVARRGVCPALRVGAVLVALGLLGLGVPLGRAGAAAAFALVGAGMQTVTVGGWVLLHRTAGAATGRVFGLLESLQLVTNAIGAGLAGVGVAHWGVWPVLVTASAALPMAALPLSAARVHRLAPGGVQVA